MTRRQQLILFVLGLTTLSVCTVAFALAMALVRQTTVTKPAAERLSMVQEGEERLAWHIEGTPPYPAPDVVSNPSGQGGAAQPDVLLAATPIKPPTPTNTRVPTWTPSPTRTPTPTRVPTDTPVPTATSTPPPPPVEQAPPATATPVVPEPTSTPEFPFEASTQIFDTGTPQMTRVTGMVWSVVNVNLALYDGKPGYQMRLVDPNGTVHLSDVSGRGGTDSTCRDCGDNQTMNMKIEMRPYLPGAYHVALMEGDTQVSPEVEFSLVASPQQYVHVNFVPWQ